MKRRVVLEHIAKFGLWLIAVLVSMTNLTVLRADTITAGGTITQSTRDGTGPAVNNPNLNKILDGAQYAIDITFDGAITSPGIYEMTGFRFLDLSDGVVENGFNSASLTLVDSGGTDSFSVFACLETGAGCNQGNELGLTFSIASAQLHAQNAGAEAIPDLLPLDLLEDDGVTDIHGSVATYSYTPVAAAPEPSPLVLTVSGVVLIALGRGLRKRPQS